MRKLEVIWGILTFFLALTITAMLFGPPYDVQSVVLEILGSAVFFVVPSLLVAFGAYTHATRGSRRGFVMLFIGSSFLTLMLFVHALGGVFYLYGLWKGAAVLTPSVAAIITLIASLFLRSASKTKSTA